MKITKTINKDENCNSESCDCPENCEMTGGCEKCNLYWNGKLSELEAEKKRLDDWKRRFDEDIKRRSKILFTPQV